MQKTILVSGSGSGIGKKTAEILAKAGYRLLLSGRNEKKLINTKNSLPNPDEHLIMPADIKNAAAIKEQLQKINPELYAIIASAGIGGENHYGQDDRWQEIIATNLTGTYQLVKESLPYFSTKENGYRHILIISSILSRIGVPNYNAYCASKAGLNGLMRSWAVEFAADKILVNSICPGWVNTEMAREGLDTYAKAANISFEEMYSIQMKDVLLGKMSEPEEIGNLIKYLVSPENISFTGQVFDINNGAYLAQ